MVETSIQSDPGEKCEEYSGIRVHSVLTENKARNAC